MSKKVKRKYKENIFFLIDLEEWNEKKKTLKIGNSVIVEMHVRVVLKKSHIREYFSWPIMQWLKWYVDGFGLRLFLGNLPGEGIELLLRVFQQMVLKPILN